MMMMKMMMMMTKSRMAYLIPTCSIEMLRLYLSLMEDIAQLTGFDGKLHGLI